MDAAGCATFLVSRFCKHLHLKVPESRPKMWDASVGRRPVGMVEKVVFAGNASVSGMMF